MGWLVWINAHVGGHVQVGGIQFGKGFHPRDCWLKVIMVTCFWILYIYIYTQLVVGFGAHEFASVKKLLIRLVVLWSVDCGAQCFV